MRFSEITELQKLILLILIYHLQQERNLRSGQSRADIYLDLKLGTWWKLRVNDSNFGFKSL